MDPSSRDNSGIDDSHKPPETKLLEQALVTGEAISPKTIQSDELTTLEERCVSGETVVSDQSTMRDESTTPGEMIVPEETAGWLEIVAPA